MSLMIFSFLVCLFLILLQTESVHSHLHVLHIPAFFFDLLSLVWFCLITLSKLSLFFECVSFFSIFVYLFRCKSYSLNARSQCILPLKRLCMSSLVCFLLLFFCLSFQVDTFKQFFCMSCFFMEFVRIISFDILLLCDWLTCPNDCLCPCLSVSKNNIVKIVFND